MTIHKPYDCSNCPIALEKKQYYLDNSESVHDAASDFHDFIVSCSSGCCIYSNNRKEYEYIKSEIEKLQSSLKNIK